MSTSIDEARAAFEGRYGSFMLAWADLEHGLSMWFLRLVELPQRRAFAVFYSAKNFAGRADMIEAILPHAEIASEYASFLRQAIKRTRQYNSSRNSVAHGQLIFDFISGSETYSQAILTGGADTPVTAAGKAVTSLHLDRASENVRELTSAVLSALDQERGSLRAASLEICLEQVRTLPTRANHARPAPNLSEPGLQPPPSAG